MNSRANGTAMYGIKRYGVVALLTLGPGISLAQTYYCPRANQLLTNVNVHSQPYKEIFHGTGGAALSFPSAPEQLKRSGGDMIGISFKMEDCTSREYFCRRVIQTEWDSPPAIYFLVVPKKLLPNHSYSYDGIRMLSRQSTLDFETGKYFVQLTIWQKIGDTEHPMELTILPGKGIVYWDGVRFVSNPDAGRQPEMCALQSETGLFSDVKALAP